MYLCDKRTTASIFQNLTFLRDVTKNELFYVLIKQSHYCNIKLRNGFFYLQSHW